MTTTCVLAVSFKVATPGLARDGAVLLEALFPMECHMGLLLARSCCVHTNAMYNAGIIGAASGPFLVLSLRTLYHCKHCPG